MDKLLFTPAAVLDLLTQIEELQDYEIGITEELNGQLQLTVGDSVYSIADETTEVLVDDTAIEDVEDANMEAYEALSEHGEVDLLPVESGIIKEVAKTLLIGGLVRLTKKLLK